MSRVTTRPITRPATRAVSGTRGRDSRPTHSRQAGSSAREPCLRGAARWHERFLLKDATADELVAAICTLAAGEALLDPTVTRRVINTHAPHAAGHDRTAPTQEHEVKCCTSSHGACRTRRSLANSSSAMQPPRPT
jgi:hypothetical protein